jgi:small-conductance mechanosensitive channel
MIKMILKLFRFIKVFTKQASIVGFVGLAFIALLMLSVPHMTCAEEESEDVNALTSQEQMAQSLENALPRLQAELADLKTQLRQLETIQNAAQTQIKAYDSQNTVHSQLLLMSSPRIEDLENAVKDNRLASHILTQQVETFQKNWDSKSSSFKKTTDRIEIARKQIADIRQSQLSDAQKQQLEVATQKLLEGLSEKKQLEARYLKTYGELLDQIKSAVEAKRALAEKLRVQLESLKKASLFQRLNFHHELSGKALLEDLQFFRDRIRAGFRLATWRAEWQQVKMGGFAPIFIFLAALTAIIVLRCRYLTILKRIEERCEGPKGYYRWLCLFLLRRSLPYLGMTLLFGFYSSVQFSFLDVDLGRFLFYIFLVLLVTRWGLDYLKHGFRGQSTALRSFISRHLRRFFRFYRAAFIVVLMLLWIAGRDSLFAWMARTVVSVCFLAWTVIFWRLMKPVVAEGVRLGQAAPNPKRFALVKGWTYFVFGGALMLNLFGYGMLAGLWMRAWTESVVLLFWGWISLNAVREWHRDFRARAAAAAEDRPLTSSYHWRWSLIQLTRVVWLIGLVAGAIWVWDPSGFIRSQLGTIFGLTIAIGSLKLSIKGIILAIIIIFITHMAARVGRALLKEKILDKRLLDRGLKDSILTITSYLGWGLGLILALGILGVDTTSLAVIFGALSIGIGFGLQNIFNNFISGLILLFERPIQVGDYVEVGGLWAEVKKINVRATVVQTFDNASVIIPNSEFISQQVTNWSFKDKRMRRSLEIGVAYGSDIDLVQKTLLDIAQQKPEVLKFPRPEVLFVDHGDSALIFRLRIWVDVDDYWTASSQIRCDIDRRFRELNIEIAFPQRDLHIRTLPREMSPVVSPEDSDQAPPKLQKDP